MFFGLTIEKLLVIGLIAALIVGPERLPRYAETLARATRRAREWVSSARTRVREEMGDEFDDVDWRTLDPRRYDPRRIIREALLDDAPVSAKPVGAAGVTAAGAATKPADATGPGRAREPFHPGVTPPFDPEAT